MSTNWKIKNLEGLGTIARGKSRHRPRNAPFLYGDKYPFVQTGDVKSANYKITEYVQMYSEAGIKQSKLWPINTLCITIAANIADAAILAIEAAFPDSIIGFEADKNKSDVRFVKYLLDLLQVRIKQVSQGAAQDNLSLEKLRTIKFLVPEVGTQRKIASILSAYDELIGNNLRRIKLLEEKANLTFTELFQNENATHWKSQKLGSLIGYDIGGGWGKEEVEKGFEDSAFVIRGTDIDNIPTGKLENVPLRWHKKSNLKSRKLQHGDLVFEVSGGSSNSGVAKSLLVTQELLSQFDDEVMCASFCKLIRLKDTSYSHFVYLFLQYLRKEKLTEIYEKRSASNIVNYNWVAFLEYQKIKIPPTEILNKFNSETENIYRLIFNLSKQIQLLKEARDILLPRLMTGMIDVEDMNTPPNEPVTAEIQSI